MTASTALPRAERAAQLAIADRDELIALAELCRGAAEEPVLLIEPEIGAVMLQVREPIVGERFHLGEVVVTRAEVGFRDAIGWCMRLGTDTEAAFAGAVCDAEAEAIGPFTEAVVELCRSTAARQARERDDEWTELAATEVAFEELD